MRIFVLSKAACLRNARGASTVRREVCPYLSLFLAFVEISISIRSGSLSYTICTYTSGYTIRRGCHTNFSVQPRRFCESDQTLRSCVTTRTVGMKRGSSILSVVNSVKMLIRACGKPVSGNQMTEGIECVLKCNLCVVRMEDSLNGEQSFLKHSGG